MENLPKISVITPCLNAAKYLDEAIQSVLGQGYPDFEHIIIDGGSTDGTLAVIRKYPHLEWVSEPDKGQSDAMNKGFAMSSGDVIVYLNADDYFEPGAFNAAVRYLDKEKGVHFVVGECRVIDDSGKELPGYDNPKVTLYEMLQWWKFLFPQNPSSYFYFREVQETVGGFDVNKHYTMDYEFLLKSACRYKLVKISEVLGNFRYIAGTKTFDACSAPEYAEQLAFAEDYWKFLSPAERVKVHLSHSRSVGRLGALAGKIKRAVKHD